MGRLCRVGVLFGGVLVGGAVTFPREVSAQEPRQQEQEEVPSAPEGEQAPEPGELPGEEKG